MRSPAPTAEIVVGVLVVAALTALFLLSAVAWGIGWGVILGFIRIA